jgi:hypothetical protein
VSTPFYVIGVSGKAQHGKDTFAALLRDVAAAHGQNLLILPFALPLKARVYGMLPKAPLEDVMDRKPIEVRQLLQFAGTEEGRNVYGTDFWVRQIEYYVAHLRRVAPFVHGIIVPDARFPNEIAFTSRYGASVRIHSDRPTLTGEAAQHPSETALDAVPDAAFEYVITNLSSTSLDELQEQAIRLFESESFAAVSQ